VGVGRCVLTTFVYLVNPLRIRNIKVLSEVTMLMSKGIYVAEVPSTESTGCGLVPMLEIAITYIPDLLDEERLSALRDVLRKLSEAGAELIEVRAVVVRRVREGG